MLNIGDKLITDHKEILYEQKKYYEKLYGEYNDLNNENENVREIELFDKHNLPILSDEDKIFNEQPIQEIEILKAIKSLKPNKTPGTDGFT